MLGYIAGIIAIVMVYVVVNHIENLDKKSKIFTVFSIILIVLSLILFEKHNDNNREKLNNVLNSFEQNKTVHCGDINVSKGTFTYSSGGHSFLGKSNSKYDRKILDAYHCK